MSIDIKFGKAPLSKIIQLSGFIGALGKLAGRLMKFGFPWA